MPVTGNEAVRGRLQEVAALAATGRFDHIIVEGSGISEPLPVAAAFAVKGPGGGTLSDVATLDTMVCRFASDS